MAQVDGEARLASAISIITGIVICSAMKAKTRLELIRLLHVRRMPAKGVINGFTLVELMIVVATIGILSTLALPQYLKVRARAEAGAKIGEAIGLAKECSAGQASKLPGNVVDITGASQICDGSAPSSFVGSWSGDAAGITCLNVTVAAETTATVTVGTAGTLSCALF